MTRFGPSIKPISFPTPSRNATCYATDESYMSMIKFSIFLKSERYIEKKKEGDEREKVRMRQSNLLLF